MTGALIAFLENRILQAKHYNTNDFLQQKISAFGISATVLLEWESIVLVLELSVIGEHQNLYTRDWRDGQPARVILYYGARDFKGSRVEEEMKAYYKLKSGRRRKVVDY